MRCTARLPRARRRGPAGRRSSAGPGRPGRRPGPLQGAVGGGGVRAGALQLDRVPGRVGVAGQVRDEDAFEQGSRRRIVSARTLASSSLRSASCSAAVTARYPDHLTNDGRQPGRAADRSSTPGSSTAMARATARSAPRPAFRRPAARSAALSWLVTRILLGRAGRLLPVGAARPGHRGRYARTGWLGARRCRSPSSARPWPVSSPSTAGPSGNSPADRAATARAPTLTTVARGLWI
jgi:hypothetical protein